MFCVFNRICVIVWHILSPTLSVCLFYSGDLQYLVLWQKGLSTYRPADGQVNTHTRADCADLKTALLWLQNRNALSHFYCAAELWSKKRATPREGHQSGQNFTGRMGSQSRGLLTSWSSSAKPRRNTREWGEKHTHMYVCVCLYKIFSSAAPVEACQQLRKIIINKWVSLFNNWASDLCEH